MTIHDISSLLSPKKSSDDDRGLELSFVGAPAGSIDVVREMLARGADFNQRNDQGRTALPAATQGIGVLDGGHIDVRFALLKNKPDLDARDKYGSTPLITAAQHNYDRSADTVTFVRALIVAGANVDSRDVDGKTALHQTAEFARATGYRDIAKELHNSKANVAIRSDAGHTPLEVVIIMRPRADSAVVALLRKHSGV